MARIEDDAIVLGRLDYSESSQVIVLYARRYGKVRAIAKGIKRSTRKRFAPGIDLLEIGQVSLVVKDERSSALATLTEWKQTLMLGQLRMSLFRLFGAQYLAEVTTHLTEDWDPHESIFVALRAALIALADGGKELRCVVHYQYQLLDAIGSLPRFDHCQSCGRAVALTHFSSFEGGMICRNCEVSRIEKWEMGDVTLQTLRGLKAPGDHSESPENWLGAFEVLNYHVAHLMTRQPHLATKLVSQARRLEAKK